ncbi:MAG: SusC/RagA family TonB-linked outer membrane protein, partial [Tannerellaceae bacterium]|nr:SusC/RagA family TonB-linked outer membrane protein [Tannerellaceae bacterium]
MRPYKTHENGQRIVNQSTGVYEFDNTQWKKVGKITPDIIGGVTTALSWKDFSLNATIDFQFGATMISQANMYLLGTGLSKETLKFRDEARGGLPYYLNTEGEKILLDSHNAAVPSDLHYNFILHDGVITPGVKEDGTKNDKLITAQQYYNNLYWNNSNEISEDKIYKSDYISMRSLYFSYNLPKKFISKYNIQNARVNA